ncbi:hypothetical protein J6590_079305 [Homalodisca vitripennis]|nr:hypothetical protein J6590_079305 [Homalodisca vitripennis]
MPGQVKRSLDNAIITQLTVFPECTMEVTGTILLPAACDARAGKPYMAVCLPGVMEWYPYCSMVRGYRYTSRLCRPRGGKTYGVSTLYIAKYSVYRAARSGICVSGASVTEKLCMRSTVESISLSYKRDTNLLIKNSFFS